MPPPTLRPLRLVDVRRLSVIASVGVALAVALAVKLHIADPLSAGFVALVCISPTAFGGLRRGIEQLGGSFVGAGVAALIVVMLPAAHEPRLAALAVVPALGLSVAISLRLFSEPTYLTAGFSALYVLLMPFASSGESFDVRLRAVACGVAGAALANVAASMVMARTILRRRVGIGRASAADALAAGAAAMLLEVELASARSATHRATALLIELEGDLADATREAGFPGAAAARREAARGLDETLLLVELVDTARAIALLVADGALADRARWAAALRALAASVATELPPAPLGVDAPHARALAEVVERLARVRAPAAS